MPVDLDALAFVRARVSDALAALVRGASPNDLDAITRAQPRRPTEPRR